ncbi:MAG: DUF1015 domain-containing protein, partial [Actinomycetota bacterium]|nr:DUF1015 domain-containing protein [Actinomycetota bacterium]
MPRLSPFVGSLFDRARVGRLEDVTAPPYDTISPEERLRLRDGSPANIVRLILAEERPGDDADRNKYTRAAEQLRAWRSDGTLVSTPGERLFPYQMRFTFRGEPRRIRGVIGEVGLEPWGGSIIPHERTLPAPVEDRLALMRAVRTNLSPIYALLRGPCGPLSDMLDGLTGDRPLAEMTDEAGVEHRLWAVEPDDSLATVVERERLLIADGHHRYTMALRYQEEMRAAHGPGPWDAVMMLVVDGATEDPPILPIHRVLTSGHVPDFGTRVRDLEEVLAGVDDDAPSIGLATWEGNELVHRVGRLRAAPPAVCALHAVLLDRRGSS